MLITGKVTEEMMIKEGMIRGGLFCVPYHNDAPLYYGWIPKELSQMTDDDFNQIEKYFENKEKGLIKD